jgi:mono/diheme cytochrome c family protein
VEFAAIKREDGWALATPFCSVPGTVPSTVLRRRSVGTEIVAVDDEGGDVKRNYLVLGIALLGMTVAVLAQDPPAKTAPKKTASKSSGSATKGKEVFDQKCGICHFADSDGKKIGPGLKGISKRGTFTVNNNKVTDETLKTWIENGDSLMPPFKDVLDEQQIKDVIAYVKTL